MEEAASPRSAAAADKSISFLEAVTICAIKDNTSANDISKINHEHDTEFTSSKINGSQFEPKIVVHCERLKASSEFFRNALKDNWVEGKNKVIKVWAHEAEVLVAYGQWLYAKNMERLSSWDFLIDCYLFGQTYCIDEFAQHTMALMLAKLSRDKRWIPSLEEIVKVYSNTVEGCGLRMLLGKCFWDARSSDAVTNTDLRETPDEFRLDLLKIAMRYPCENGLRGFHSNPSHDNVDKYYRPYGQYDQEAPLGTFFLSTMRDFENTVNFTLRNSTKTGVVHLRSLGRTGNTVGLAPTQTGILNIESLLKPRFHRQFLFIECDTVRDLNIDASTFSIFASWLYFDDDLEAHSSPNSSTMDINCLLSCYEAAQTLLQVESLIGKRPAPLSSIELVSLLHFQAARFKDDVVRALATHWEKRQNLPTEHQIAAIYSITQSSDDPLRRLVSDLYVWYGKPDSLLTLYPDFQFDLCNSLMAANIELRARSNKGSSDWAGYGSRHSKESPSKPIESRLASYQDQSKYQASFEMVLDDISQILKF